MLKQRKQYIILPVFLLLCVGLMGCVGASKTATDNLDGIQVDATATEEILGNIVVTGTIKNSEQNDPVLIKLKPIVIIGNQHYSVEDNYMLGTNDQLQFTLNIDLPIESFEEWEFIVSIEIVDWL